MTPPPATVTGDLARGSAAADTAADRPAAADANTAPPARAHPDLPVRWAAFELNRDERRVITRPFPVSADRASRLTHGVDAMSCDTLRGTLAAVERDYAPRHERLDEQWFEHFARLREDHPDLRPVTEGWDRDRRRLLGAYLTLEYSVEAAALFNPSICLAPGEDGTGPEARFVMSLRATGEGHVSSIVFRSGRLGGGRIHFDPLPPKLQRARRAAERAYDRSSFRTKLAEMSLDDRVCDALVEPLPERFTHDLLLESVGTARDRFGVMSESTLESAVWLIESNYHVELPDEVAIDGLAVFPLSDAESNGMEDLRLTRFMDDEGRVNYYGTYTAYNGHRTLPMLLSTEDFHRLQFHSLNGPAAKNKGTALFPRKIGGRFVACGRIDGESLQLLRSDSVHYWEDARPLLSPREPWELMLMGNCGAPIETDAGWLLLTHGVGPMRTYALGAVLLDLDDPSRVLGRLRMPLISPNDTGREGYVPNVVYTCGALSHAGTLYLPFALADSATAFATVDVKALTDRLLHDGP